MPASSFSIQAPDPAASSAPASTIHGLDKSMASGAPGTSMTMPTETTTGSHGGSFYDPPRDY
jgi:hypothetical protein